MQITHFNSIKMPVLSYAILQTHRFNGLCITRSRRYVNGELMGGCDIVLEMAESGELRGAIDDMLATN
jgi:glutaredoxin-related protein